MSYRKLEDIAADLKAELTTLEYFNEVRAAAVTDQAKLMDVIGVLKPAPAAVICLGPAEYERHGLLRHFEVTIISLGQFDATMEDLSIEAWETLEKTISPFLPESSVSGPFVKSGVMYELTGYVPFAIKGLNCGVFIVNLSATETFEDNIGI